MLCSLPLFVYVLFMFVKDVNELDSSMRAHQNTWGESVTGTEIGLGKRQRGLELL